MKQKYPGELKLTQVIQWSIYCLCLFIPLSKSGVEIFAISAGVLWLFSAIRQPGSLQNGIRRFPEIAAVVLLFAAATISSVNSSLVFESAGLLFSKLAEFLLLFLAVSLTIHSTAHQQKACLCFLLGSSIFAVMTLYQVTVNEYFFSNFHPCFSDGAISGIPGTRYYSRIGSVAGVLAPIFLITSISPVFHSVTVRRLFFLAALLLYACIPISMSPLVWAGSFAVLLWLWIVLVRFQNHKSRIAFCSAWLFAMLSTFVVLRLSERRGMIAVDFWEKHFSYCYLEVWRYGLELFYSSPITGVGYGVYQSAGPGIVLGKNLATYPPSAFMQIAVEVGVLGISAYLFFALLMVRLVLRALAIRKDPLLCAYSAAVVVFLGQSSTDNTLYSVQISALFWLLLGLTAARATEIYSPNKCQTTEKQ